jgi:hypothetical protein
MTLLLPACSNNGTGRLPPEKMEAVLWDLMRADKFLSDYVLNKDSTKKIDTESVNLYKQVFAIHNITGEQFQKSFAYYKAHPDLLKGIMDSLSRPPMAEPTEMVQPVPLSPVQSSADSFQRKNDTVIRPVKKVVAID